MVMARNAGKTTGGQRRATGTGQDRGRGILTRVNADGLRALRILAIERECTLQALVVEALNDVLAKHGRRRIVRNPLIEGE